MKKKYKEARIEKEVETYLCDAIKSLGGKAYKFSSPSNRGVPDRICLLPGGKMILIECKAPGKIATPLQRFIIRSMQAMGHEVMVIDSILQVNALYDVLKEELKDDII